MKSMKEVCDILDLSYKQLENITKPTRNHREILDKLGCHIQGNKYLFSEEGIKYIAYQYMSKIDECFYYIFPNKRPDGFSKNPSKKPAVTKRMLKQIKRM